MKPAWFEIEDIPYAQMWSDDVLWFPLMLKGSKFSGYFLFKGLHKIVKYKLDKVDKIDYWYISVQKLCEEKFVWQWAKSCDGISGNALFK